MRIDHHAYQRATRVAGFGLLLQIAIGVLLLVLGLVSEDTIFQFSALYILIGVLAWVGLVIIFHQHKLERLEALEEDELAATRGGAGSFFDNAGDESKVAARRLAMMHTWLMPIFSLVIALSMSALATWMLMFMKVVRTEPTEFHLTEQRGWAISICLSIAAVSFIFSRFVAGMAKQAAWQNLRGGAAYMVGNALIMVAVAAGLIFRFFENDSVIRGMSYGIIAYLYLLSIEIVLNFVLNLYRPRIPGEVPRPAFDSKILSLFATPDSLVRSLNEAVNYQFGFDVTSSWGYQLLLRSFVWLLVLAVAALVLMSTMVVVEPYQQAIRLRGGALVGGKIYQSGIMWKLPWPIESALVYDVTKVRSLHLTAKVKELSIPLEQRVSFWNQAESPQAEGTLDPFLVGSTRLGELQQQIDAEIVRAAAAKLEDAGQDKTQEQIQQEQAAQIVSNFFSLVEAEIVLQYRIRHDADQQHGGLIDYLHFGTDSVARRQSLNDRERALRVVALGEISQHLATLSLNEVLSPGTSNLTKALADRVQTAFDRERAGVEVVAIAIPMLRPAGGSAPSFEELGISLQASRQLVAVAEREAYKELTAMIGDVSLADTILQGIDEFDAMVRTKGATAPEAIAKRQEVEEMLRKGGGSEAQIIGVAERDRWYELMKTRGQASRWQGELESYRAAPQLYRQREIMKVYSKLLPEIPKYIIGIDPSRVNIDFDLKNANPLVDFVGASEEELKKNE